jgi:hypothetical protein
MRKKNPRKRGSSRGFLYLKINNLLDHYLLRQKFTLHFYFNEVNTSCILSGGEKIKILAKIKKLFSSYS